MNRVRIELLIGAAFLAASFVAAQGIGWLDLTDPHPRDRLRAPHSFGSACSGVGGFIPNLQGTVTLMNLDKTSYAMGEEVSFEVKIQNSGKEPIDMPWTPNSADLEPADASKSYTYLHAAVSLKFTESVSNRSFSVYANSYGSPDVPGTIQKLQPGQWIYVRASRKIEVYEDWWWTKVKDSAPLDVTASAGLMLGKVTYSPGDKNNPAVDHYVCIPLVTKLGAASNVTLWPAVPK